MNKYKEKFLIFPLYLLVYFFVTLLSLVNISAINPVATENLDDSCKHREAVMRHYCELTPCAVSKDKWDTKEDTSKSMKHVYALQYVKRHLSG